jgi:hypothetical protein
MAYVTHLPILDKAYAELNAELNKWEAPRLKRAMQRLIRVEAFALRFLDNGVTLR